MAGLILLDQQITNLIVNFLPRNFIFDKVFYFFSFLGSSIWVWLTIIIILIIAEEKKDKRFLIYFTLSFLATSFLVNLVLKNYFPRQRPYAKYQIAQQSCPNTSSFPSGHSALAFASVFMLGFFDKKRKWFYYLFAFFVALSRIYLHCHFFLDTVFGAVIGIAISWVVIKLFYRQNKT